MYMVRGRLGFHRNQVEKTVANAPLGDELFREGTNVVGVTTQKQGFQAVVVIQMDVHGRDDDIVGMVLEIVETFGQAAFVVVVNVGETGDAVGGFDFFQTPVFQFTPDNVAHGFRAVGVTAFADQAVKGLG